MVYYSYLKILVPAQQVTMQKLSYSKVMMSYTLLVARSSWMLSFTCGREEKGGCCLWGWQFEFLVPWVDNLWSTLHRHLVLAILHKVSQRLVLVPRVEIVPIILAHFPGIALDALVAVEDAGLVGLQHHHITEGWSLSTKDLSSSRLEHIVGAQAGHLAQLISSRGSLANACCSLRYSWQSPVPLYCH